MAGNIKPSFFSTGPKDDLIVADVYKPVGELNQKASVSPSEAITQSASTVVRNDPKTAQKAIQGALEGITKSANAAFAKNTQGKTAVDAFGREKQVQQYLGGGDVTSMLGGDFTKEVLKGLGVTEKTLKQQAIEIGVSGIVGSNVLSEKTNQNLMRLVQSNGVDEISKIVKNGDRSTAGGLQNLLGAIGSSTTLKVLDLDTQFAVLTAMIDKADAYGLVNVADVVLEQINNEDDQRQFILDNVFRFFTNSDLLSINKAIDLMGVGGVMARVPDGINLLLRYYRYPSSLRQADDPEKALQKQYDLLIGTLNRLDSTWYQIEWNEITRINLEPYYGASRDAETVLQLNADHYRRCILAKRFTQRTVKQFCSAQYPYLKIAQ